MSPAVAQKPRIKKGALSCLRGFIREPKPQKKGIRALLVILAPVTLRIREVCGPFAGGQLEPTPH